MNSWIWAVDRHAARAIDELWRCLIGTHRSVSEIEGAVLGLGKLAAGRCAHENEQLEKLYL